MFGRTKTAAAPTLAELREAMLSAQRTHEELASAYAAHRDATALAEAYRARLAEGPRARSELLRWERGDEKLVQLRAEMARRGKTDPAREAAISVAEDAARRARADYQRYAQAEFDTESDDILEALSARVGDLYDLLDALDVRRVEASEAQSVPLHSAVDTRARQLLAPLATLLGVDGRESPSALEAREELAANTPAMKRRESRRSEARERASVLMLNGRDLETVQAAIRRQGTTGIQRATEQRGERLLDERERDRRLRRGQEIAEEARRILADAENA